MSHPNPTPTRYPYPARLLGGVVVFLAAIAIYQPIMPWASARVGVARDFQRWSSVFMTPQHATRLLSVPFHRQEHSLSCEIASLRSALLAVGVDVPERILMDALPFDETPKGKADASGVFTWGDPDEGFVGNIDGKMPSTGYGVHAGGIAKAATLYAMPIPVRVNDPATIVSAINNGHPIIAWSVLGKNPRTITWKTPAGKDIRAALYEHSVVIAGYKGNVNKIETIYLVDPLTGLREEPWNEFVWRTSFLDHQGLEIQKVGF